MASSPPLPAAGSYLVSSLRNDHSFLMAAFATSVALIAVLAEQVVEGVGQRGRPASRAASQRARTFAAGHSRGTRGLTNRPPPKRPSIGKTAFCIFFGLSWETSRKHEKV